MERGHRVCGIDGDTTLAPNDQLPSPAFTAEPRHPPRSAAASSRAERQVSERRSLALGHNHWIGWYSLFRGGLRTVPLLASGFPEGGGIQSIFPLIGYEKAGVWGWGGRRHVGSERPIREDLRLLEAGHPGRGLRRGVR